MISGVNPVIEMKTNKGTIEFELYQDKAPQTVENILKYVNDGFYTDIVFHRVIDNFMIQVGGFTSEHSRKDPTYPSIQNEADNKLGNERGTLAMARTGEPHSASSQFFINLKDNTFLNHRGKSQQGWGYCVFGKVTKGMDVVDAIAKSDTGVDEISRMKDWPATDVVIESMKVMEKE
ncbi:MAG: peptidylprolyl isomerase [Candidatus Cloacimonetes bacterium]|nr:peptidylprolyl isomerase [Candidatus Cloacimonadota bacterium]